ncbi:MAG: TolC family protein [Gemmatimonadetes bacterium]|nr:TolC family protein [Gemmatimonadota bacterium]MCA9762881.1 TolC family protein [Gemmatimonadota bacterium]HPF61910.1 TolC family protein [Gemmatimonadales bacterium]
MHITTRLTLSALVVLLGARPLPVVAQAGVDSTTASLDAFTAEVLERSPALHAADHRVAASRATAAATGAPPDPQLRLGVANLPVASPGVADMMTMKEIGIAQRLPFPGKLSLAREAADRAVGVAAAGRDGVVARLIRETREAWYELALIDARLDILTARRDALRAMSRTVEARYESGDGSQAAVWRSRAELSRLVERAADLAEHRRGVVARLNALRQRPAGGPIDSAPMPPRILAAALPSPELLRFAGDSLGAALVDDGIPTPDVLLAWALDSNPMIRGHVARIGGQDARVALAARAGRPDVEVMVMYGQRNDRSDFVSAGVAIPLAIRSGRVQRQLHEAEELELEAEHAEHQQMVADIAAKLAALRAAAVAQRTRLAVLGHHVLPQGRAALASALAGHRAGTVPFIEVIEAVTTLHDDEERHAEALASYATSIAAIEALVGREILP